MIQRSSGEKNAPVKKKTRKIENSYEHFACKFRTQTRRLDLKTCKQIETSVLLNGYHVRWISV